MKKILIIVPAYNEAENIQSVINGLYNTNKQWDILVINDCSKDNTSNLVKLTKKARVIDLSHNLGIGGCVQTGFKIARKYNYDVAVQFDGDGQHKKNQIEKLIRTLESGEYDVVIGSRFCIKNNNSKSTTQLRRIGIKVFEIINSFILKHKITDNTSGFRAYNKNAIRFLSNSYPSDYPEPEAVVLLHKNNFKIKEIYVDMQERQGGTSSILGIKSIYYMIKVIFAILLNCIRKKEIEEES